MKRMMIVVAFLLLAGVGGAQVSMIPKGSGGGGLTSPVGVADGGTGSTSGVGLVDTCTDSVGTDSYACSTATTCPANLANTRPVLFTAGTANTDGATFAYCSLAAKAIVKTVGGISTALATNDILAKQPVLVRYNATDDNWKMISAISNAPTATVTTASIEDATYCGASAVGSDSYACTLTTAPANLAAMEGVVVSFKADVANTGASTIAFNGFAATPIVKIGATVTTATVTGDIRAGDIVTVRYDGTSFACLSCDGNRASLTGVVQTWTASNTFSGYLSATGGLGSVITAVTTTATTSNTTSGELYTNTGDADGATITLQDNPTTGTTWFFAVNAAQTLTIVKSTGETLMHGASTCGTSLTSNTVGSTIIIKTIVAGSGGVFMTFGATGTWVCNA